MTTQKSFWGYINWLYTIDEKQPGQSKNNIGICVILPGQRQQPHVHYGVDQFIYILEGESLEIVDGVETVLSQGMHMFMKSGLTHESVNYGETPVMQLLVSTPVADYRRLEVPVGAKKPAEANRPGYRGNIYAATESLRAQLADSFQAPFAIFDAESNLILQNNLYSDFCRGQCRPNARPYECECLTAREDIMIRDDHHFWFSCQYGFLIYHVPILFRHQRLGYIRGGHIICSELTGDYGLDTNEYDNPKSTAMGIIKILWQVVKSVVAYCEFDEARLEIENKNKKLVEDSQQKKRLEHSLRITEDTVTNLKINRHFLFNTLNCMAGMAVQKNVNGLYSAILSLSRQFRYVMPSERRYVILKEELTYLQDYLTLQGFRHGESLKVVWKVEVEPERYQVAFNFLQPVVENAFTHGFIDRNHKLRIEIAVKKEINKLVFTIRNNGAELDEITLLRIKKGLSSNSGHGLSLIYNKLQFAYGDGFEMDITSQAGGLTCVRIALPTRWAGPASASYGHSAAS